MPSICKQSDRANFVLLRIKTFHFIFSLDSLDFDVNTFISLLNEIGFYEWWGLYTYAL